METAMKVAVAVMLVFVVACSRPVPDALRVVKNREFKVAFDISDPRATHFALYKDGRPVSINRVQDFRLDARSVKVTVPPFDKAGWHTIAVSSISTDRQESKRAELRVYVDEK
jgi:hypothetical protein